MKKRGHRHPPQKKKKKKKSSYINNKKEEVVLCLSDRYTCVYARSIYILYINTYI